MIKHTLTKCDLNYYPVNLSGFLIQAVCFFSFGTNTSLEASINSSVLQVIHT